MNLFSTARSPSVQTRKNRLLELCQTPVPENVVFAVFGLSAILATSALAFSAVKYAGAAYLIYLDITKLLEKGKSSERTITKSPHSKLFWQGFVVQILNPKTALFFLAFLPQFVDTARGSIAWQMLVLGLTFVSLAFMTDSLYAIFAGRIGKKALAATNFSSLGKWPEGFEPRGRMADKWRIPLSAMLTVADKWRIIEPWAVIPR